MSAQIKCSIVGSLLISLFIRCGEEPKKKTTETKIAHDTSILATPLGKNSSLPFLFSNGERTYMSYVEQVGDSLSKLKYTELIDDEWQSPTEILSGSDWFVNWADFPMITENNGHLMTHILKKSGADTYSYDIKLNILKDGEPKWKTDLSLHTDGTPTEHGFVSSLPYQDGFFITWLDGRNTMEGEDSQRGAMTIRAAEVAINGTVSNETELDASTCDCCQTTAAITGKGPVVLYRDRSEDEIRDISIVRKINGEWTPPKPIHEDGWQIKGCPVNGPKATALGNTLVAAWFTGAQQNSRVQLVFSDDGGASFDTPIRVDKGNALGRVDVLLLDKEKAVVSWMEAFEDKALVKAVLIHRDGTKGEVRILAELDASRKTGFPQMELVGDQVYFAWTDVTDNKSQVRWYMAPQRYFLP